MHSALHAVRSNTVAQRLVARDTGCQSIAGSGWGLAGAPTLLMRVLNSAELLIQPLSVPSMDTAAKEAFMAGRSFWYLVGASKQRAIVTL